MKIKFLLTILFCLNVVISAQDDNNKLFTGSLSTDAKLVLGDYQSFENPQIKFFNENKKSPFLAGAMSLLIPGAGEIYAEEYLKAGIFVAIEATVITVGLIYDGKGDDKTIEFQNYADDYTNSDHNWSVVQYAKWLVKHSYDDNQELLNRILKSDNPNLPPWEQVNWAELNNAETGSHKLPKHGDQQYYELIGKYPQFSHGWNKADINDPNYHNIPDEMLIYSSMRGDANDFYTVARTAVIGIYLNHFLSALDAIWSVSSYNKNLAVKVRMENIQLADHAEFYPKLYLSYNF
jgi:hypothetical protein